jgi:hypothetical protein
MWLTLFSLFNKKPKGSKEQMEINSKQLTVQKNWCKLSIPRVDGLM